MTFYKQPNRKDTIGASNSYLHRDPEALLKLTKGIFQNKSRPSWSHIARLMNFFRTQVYNDYNLYEQYWPTYVVKETMRFPQLSDILRFSEFPNNHMYIIYKCFKIWATLIFSRLLLPISTIQDHNSHLQRLDFQKQLRVFKYLLEKL